MMRAERSGSGGSGTAAGQVARPAGGVRAFTLLEVLIVLSLLVLMASFAWPAMESQIRATELPESADRVRSLLYMARCEAVMEHRRYRIRFEPESQQPLVEYEPDPIRRAGAFEPVPSDWAEEAKLLGDVQVHEVQLGRPIWTKPLSMTSDPDALEEEEEEEEALEEGFGEDDHQRDLFLRSIPLNEDVEVDENRPMIVFEADGSCDWATLILARVDPAEELEEETPQLWVVLDGRTGLAFVRDQVTEEQLSDPEFFVEREKLELPDLLDIDNLSFEISEKEEAGLAFGDDGLGLEEGLFAGGDGGEASAGDEELDQDDFTIADTTGGARPGERGARRAPGANAGPRRTPSGREGATMSEEDARGNRGTRQPRGAGRGSSGDRRPRRGSGRQQGAAELDERLNDSDLTEVQRRQARKWSRGGRQ